MRVLGRLVTAIAIGSVVNASFAQESGDSGPQPVEVPEVSVPNDVQSDGSFQYTIPFSLPEFRDLTPSIGLQYSSSFKGHGTNDAHLGVGWQLNGFSTIERVSVGGGIPSYENAHDIYRLDGMELMACADSAATNPWSSLVAYPDRYKTDNPSASCSARGNLAPMIEDYSKIEAGLEAIHNGQSNVWITNFTVTRKDGTRYHYESLGKLAGQVPQDLNDGPDVDDVLFKRKWLLTRIEDAQADPNVVEFSYAFDSGNAWASRPVSISYGNGYRVDFLYERQGRPLASYGVGQVKYFGAQHYRLSTVAVYDVNQKVRAYSMSYAKSALGELNLLQRVDLYGNNFVLSADKVIAGSQLPSPVSGITYSEDAIPFSTRVDYDGPTFHRNFTSMDVNGDSRDELFFTGSYLEPGTCLDSDDRTVRYDGYDLPGSVTFFDENNGMLASIDTPSRSVSEYPFLEREFFDFYGDDALYITPISDIEDWYPDLSFTELSDMPWVYAQLLGGTRYSPAADSLVYFAEIWEPSALLKMVRVPTVAEAFFDGTSNLLAEKAMTATDTPQKVIVGNFDGDAEPEVLTETGIYDWLPPATLQLKRDDDIEVTQTKVADLDGDGVDELVTGFPPLGDATPNYSFMNVLDFRETDVVEYEVSTSNAYNDEHVGPYVDINGDGAADVVRRNGGRAYVSLSSGRGFKNPSNWGTISTFNGNFSYQYEDVNSDGLLDIVAVQGKQAGNQYNCWKVQFDANSARVFINKGHRFDGWQVEIPDFLGFADVNGDSMPDAILEPGELGKGRIWYNDVTPPNLLMSLVEGGGGTITVEYEPSTTASNYDNRVPGVYQLAKSITRSNGRGDSRTIFYNYAGSKYDYENRRPMGYAMVSASLPKIDGEVTRPRVVTHYDNDHIVHRGRVTKRSVTFVDLDDNIPMADIWQQTETDWNYMTFGNGPYRAQKVGEWQTVRYGDSLIETGMEYTNNIYGEPFTVRELGFTNLTENMSVSDDLIRTFNYTTNLDAYIIKPSIETLTSGNGSPLQRFGYFYDGASKVNDSPVHGNLTRVNQWVGESAPFTSMRMAEVTGYDTSGNVVSETNARGFTTTHEYDVRKLFRVASTNALGHNVTTTWDKSCQVPVSMTDANGNTTSYGYDEFCREVQKSLPNGQVYSTNYVNFGIGDRQHTLVSSIAENGGVFEQREYFDGFGEAYKSVSTGATTALSDAIVVLTGYNRRGQQAWVSNPMVWSAIPANDIAASSERTEFSYDTMGRLTATTAPDGARTQMQYAGELYQGLLHPRQLSQDAHCFDSDASTICGQVWTVTDARGYPVKQYQQDDGGAEIATSFKYDVLGRLEQVVDPLSAVFDYTYDTFGNRVFASDPGLGDWSLSYDENGNLISQIDAKQQQIAFSYDALDRVTTKVVSGGGQGDQITTSTYDEPRFNANNTGALTTLSLGEHTVEYDYDEMGLVSSETHSVDGLSFSIQSDYGVTGAMVSQTLPETTVSGTVVAEYFYDSANRPLSLSRNGGTGESYISSVTYDVRSNPLQIVYGNGAVETRTYDAARGWINTIQTEDSQGNIVDLTSYVRSATGRVKRQDTTRAEGQLDYTYDYAGRLLNAINRAGLSAFDQSFSYNAAGSMVSNSSVGSYLYGGGAPAHAPAQVYDAMNGLTHSFSYDANGNMTVGLHGKAMTYDAENRPLSVTHNGLTTSYVYAADGTRLKKIEKTATGAQTTTLYLGPLEIREPGRLDAQLLAYPHPAIRLTDGQPATLHRDQLSSVRVITNVDGEKAKESTYKPFGEATDWIADVSETNETKGFIGERYDEDSGLQYLNARYYDPELSMFILPDLGGAEESDVMP